jgi:hypothetical protein
MVQQQNSDIGFALFLGYKDNQRRGRWKAIQKRSELLKKGSPQNSGGKLKIFFRFGWEWGSQMGRAGMGRCGCVRVTVAAGGS